MHLKETCRALATGTGTRDGTEPVWGYMLSGDLLSLEQDDVPIRTETGIQLQRSYVPWTGLDTALKATDRG